MSAATLLSRLNKVRRISPGRWKACCPAHDDRHPSLSITEKDDGMVLINCLSGGCGAMDVIGVLGVDPSELFPPSETGHRSPIRNPVFRSDVFDQITFETCVIWLIGCDMHKNKTISEQDYRRLGQAVGTLQRIKEGAYAER